MHVVNFLILIFVLWSFEVFLSTVIGWPVPPEFDVETVGLPCWAIRLLSYALFLASATKWLTVEAITPDLLVEGILFLVAACVVKIRAGDRGWKRFVVLGLLLGLGFLSKAIFFPLAFVFLAVGFFAAGSSTRAIAGTLLALVVFSLIASPFVLALSRERGKFAYSDSGWLNYLWCVDIPAPFGDSAGSGLPPSDDGKGSLSSAFGVPIHPIRQLLANPPLFEFARPIGGTYPFWYNPAYWYEGMKPRILLRRQLEVLKSNLYIVFDAVIATQLDPSRDSWLSA